MPRATNSPASRARRKRVLNKAKGFRGFRSTHYRYAKDAVRKAMTYAYRDRKVRKRNFRRLWTLRINAGSRPLGLSYSRFMEGLKAAQIQIDRKVLADLVVHDHAGFAAIVAQAKDALSKKQEAAKKAA
jgi:large subunit ribosomal protein L20